jgi:hypothetical protein
VEFCHDDNIAFGAKKYYKHLHSREDQDKLNRQNSHLFTVFDSSFHLHISWLTPKSSFLTDTLNDFLLHSEQHGFTQHFYDAEYVYSSTLPEPDPKKLTLDILSAGFIVWLITVMIACFVFVIEHVVAYFTRKP